LNEHDRIAAAEAIDVDNGAAAILTAMSMLSDRPWYCGVEVWDDNVGTCMNTLVLAVRKDDCPSALVVTNPCPRSLVL
jgi:hypothetical protein